MVRNDVAYGPNRELDAKTAADAIDFLRGFLYSSVSSIHSQSTTTTPMSTTT